MTPDQPGDALDVIVVGAGQTGLALGWHLRHQRQRFVIVDAAPTIGHAWRTRWDSLRLFSPARYNALPGMDFPAPPESHPTKDDVADYLAAYATRFELPVLLGHHVLGVTHDPTAPRSRFTVHTNQGPLRSHQLVIATGGFGRPHVPDMTEALPDDVLQLHSGEYRNPSQLLTGDVLVVGAGNSGLQIAQELATDHRRTGRDRVHLAVGSKPVQLPQRFAGRDLFWWLTKTGAINRPATSLLARRLRARGDLVIGASRTRVERLGVVLHPRVANIADGAVEFADRTTLTPRTVIWATGFRADYSWLAVPGVHGDTPGRVLHDRGVTAAAGLYFLGLPWQHTRGSALLGFVRHDAAWLADTMHAERASR